MLQDLADPDWILQPALAPALDAIAAEGLVFDALILSHQIGAITELARRHPQLAIVLDHAAKPRLGDADAMAGWARDMEKLAAHAQCHLQGQRPVDRTDARAARAMTSPAPSACCSICSAPSAWYGAATGRF